mmetsp:Transcript_23292/g.40284  ORF Transcript_23292/g.40284 Transcript_23292/m.40284 type:complete len:292 (+) Transcript_23292:3707-4582(+)
MQNVGMGAPVRDTAGGPGLRRAANEARWVQKACKPHLGNGLDNARPTDAGDARDRRCRIKAILIRPQINADHPKTGLFRNGINLDPLNRARCGALPTGDLRALKGRTGGRRTGQHLVAIAQQNFGIGAHVHHQDQVIRLVWRLRQCDGRRIRADMARDAGQQVNTGRGVDVEVQIIGAQAHGIGCGQGKRGLTKLEGVDAKKEVVHHRVADKDRIDDQPLVDLRLGRDLGEQGVHPLADRAGHLSRAAGVHHAVTHPAHQVLAKADLRVHDARGGDHLSRNQVAQMGGDGG